MPDVRMIRRIAGLVAVAIFLTAAATTAAISENIGFASFITAPGMLVLVAAAWVAAILMSIGLVYVGGYIMAALCGGAWAALQRWSAAEAAAEADAARRQAEV